jgi:hypothetical protein
MFCRIPAVLPSVARPERRLFDHAVATAQACEEAPSNPVNDDRRHLN